MTNDLIPEIKPEHVAWVNQQAIPLRNNFLAIQAILHGKMSVRNLNVAYNCFINIFKVIPLMFTPLQGARILRARLYQYGESLYSEQQQISYTESMLTK